MNLLDVPVGSYFLYNLTMSWCSGYLLGQRISNEKVSITFSSGHKAEYTIHDRPGCKLVEVVIIPECNV